MNALNSTHSVASRSCIRPPSLNRALGPLLLILCLTGTVHAGPLEEATQRLLAQLPKATEDETEAIIGRLAEIGPEARSAQPILVDFLEAGKFELEAVSALASMGRESVEAVRSCLMHHNPAVRWWMLQAVQNMRHDAEPLIPVIIGLTHDEDDEVRRTAIETLGELDLRPEITVPCLVAALASDDAALACDALRQLEDPGKAAIAALETAAVQHPDPYVRCRALSALIAVGQGGEAATRAVGHGLRDTDQYGLTFSISVQEIAAEELSLMALKPSKVAPILLQIMRDDGIRDDHWRYERISFSMASLHITDAVPILQRDLQYQQFQNDADYAGSFADRIVPATYEQTCIRVSAAGALARLQKDNKDTVAVLVKTLEDEQWQVVAPAGVKGADLLDPRDIAAYNLGLLDEEAASALPALKRVMSSGRQDATSLRIKAAWAIARIDPQDRSCLPILKAAHFSNPTLWEAPFYRESPESIPEVLGERLQDVLPAIIEAALTYDAQRREYYISVLASAGDLAVLKLVERAFQIIESPEEWVFRNQAYLALDVLGPRAEPAIDALIALLASKHHLVRAEAARLLGVIGRQPEKVVPALQPLLKDERVLVRVRAAAALGRFGSRSAYAIDELRQLATNDDYGWVREVAAEAVTAIANK